MTAFVLWLRRVAHRLAGYPVCDLCERIGPKTPAVGWRIAKVDCGSRGSYVEARCPDCMRGE